MAVPTPGDHKHFTIFKSAAEEAADAESRAAGKNEGAPVAQTQAPPKEAHPEAAIEELLFALYAEDVRLGIVRTTDVVDADGALSARGGAKYRRRAVAILRSLTRVPDAQIVDACRSERPDTPRGAAARVEALRRGVLGKS